MGFISQGYFLFCPGLNGACSLIFQRSLVPIAEHCQMMSGNSPAFSLSLSPAPTPPTASVAQFRPCTTVLLLWWLLKQQGGGQICMVPVLPYLPGDGQTCGMIHIDHMIHTDHA